MTKVPVGQVRLLDKNQENQFPENMRLFKSNISFITALLRASCL